MKKKNQEGYRDRIDDCDSNNLHQTSRSKNNNSNTDLIEAENEPYLYGTHDDDSDDDSDVEDDDDDDKDKRVANNTSNNTSNNTANSIENEGDGTIVTEISVMTGQERFHLVLRLWPYMVPLFTVYVAEYTLQSGTWTAIGFPVTDQESRDTFYQYSNWMYQAGVFVSRSSGSFFLAPMALLWVMPILQVVNVGIYWAIAASQQTHGDIDVAFDYSNGIDGGFFYSPVFLYSAAFYTGLLGGAVYIHGYLRICRDLPLAHREFALSATSLAESLGIVVADLLGLLVQACLYRINALDGAAISCPF